MKTDISTVTFKVIPYTGGPVASNALRALAAARYWIAEEQARSGRTCPADIIKQIDTAMRSEADRIARTTHPTGAEMRGHFGDNWAICRATAANKWRYDTCVTPKQHKAACEQIYAPRAAQILACI